MNTRQATIQDLETLIEMGEQLYFSEKEFEPLLTFSKDVSRERYKKELSNPNALLLVAQDSEKIIGYLYAHADRVEYFSTSKAECEIEVVYVASEYRGQGIAGQLIDGCVAWAKDKHIFRFTSGIYAQNVSSQSAFMKYGFVPYHSTYVLLNE